MSLFQDFSFELDAQKEVVRYIEISFEEEFGKASRLLESPLRPIGDVYSDNAEFISELKAKFDNAKAKISMGWQDAEEYPEWLYRVDQRDPLGEMINYCVDCIDNGESIDAERLNSEIVEWNEHMGERVYTGEMVEKALSVATSVWKHRINSGLENDDMNLDRLAATIRMLDVTANSNIYRQAFVNMFSIFDAYVFDYLKTYFFNHIDKLESFFGGEKTKLPYEDVFKNSTIEEAKEDFIRKKFDGKYIKHLLKALHHSNTAVFDGIEYHKIMEMVNRRNIHIHNKGIVDDRYIEEYNIFSYDVGEYAAITKQYFDSAATILSAFIQNLESKQV